MVMKTFGGKFTVMYREVKICIVQGKIEGRRGRGQ